jgi:taurine dehydrogenase small subunit
MAIATANEVSLGFLEAFGAAWNRHDVDAIMAAMTDDCVFDITAGPDACGKRYEGRERVRQAVARVFSIWADAHFGSARHFVSGHRGLSEWVFTGTRADGTRMEVNGCDVFTFRDGKIAHKDSYFKHRVA